MMEHKQHRAMDYGTPLKTFGGIAVYEDLDMPPPAWLVEDLIIEHGHHVIYAMTKFKKSFLAMDLGLRLVNGMDYHGKKTTPCEVVYVVGEDTPEFIKRQDAWLKHYGKTRKLKSIPYPVQFKDNDGGKFADLIDAVEYYGAGLVIFDNLADVTVGIKIVDNDEYNAYVKPLRKKLTERTGAATLFLHHTNKQNGNSPLGAGTISNDANMVAKVGKPDDDTTTLTVDFIRGAKRCKPMSFKSVPVTVPRGKTIVLDTELSKAKGQDAGETEKVKPKATGKTKAAKITDIERIRLAVAEHGPAAPATIAKVTGIDYRKVTANLSKLTKRGGVIRTADGYATPT